MVLSLVICIIIGFLLGLCISPWAEDYGCTQWPTNEMNSRGHWRSLWVGVLIAVPSGAGVALSVLGGNAGSLVGVAISASLLPPAVNCGVFWAISAILASYGDQDHTLIYTDQTNSTAPILFEHCCETNLPLQAFILGLISLLLTLINILCIIATGVFILRLKEVTPEKVPQKFAHFWKEDIKAHRTYSRKIRKGDPLEKKLKRANTPSEIQLEGTFLQSMFERAAQDEELINIRQWVAMPGSAMVPEHQSLAGTVRTRLVTSPSHPLTTLNGDKPRRRNRTTSSTRAPDNYLTLAGTYLDVQNFLQQELKRSQEVRRRLYAGEESMSA